LIIPASAGIFFDLSQMDSQEQKKRARIEIQPVLNPISYEKPR
jgi:hypothetical protein